jgi:hypothetical protein
VRDLLGHRTLAMTGRYVGQAGRSPQLASPLMLPTDELAAFGGEDP